MQPVSLAKLGLDHKRRLLVFFVFVRGAVAVVVEEQLSGRAVGRPKYPDVHAEETIAHVEGTLQLCGWWRLLALTTDGRWERGEGGRGGREKRDINE